MMFLSQAAQVDAVEVADFPLPNNVAEAQPIASGQFETVSFNEMHFLQDVVGHSIHQRCLHDFSSLQLCFIEPNSLSFIITKLFVFHGCKDPCCCANTFVHTVREGYSYLILKFGNRVGQICVGQRITFSNSIE